MSRFEPDRLDLRILAALCRDGRQTITDLCGEVSRSPTPLAARMQRMEQAGVITGYAADIDIARLAGCSPYCVTLTLITPLPSLVAEVEALIRASPYIVYCNWVPNDPQYVFLVYARSVQHYLDIMEPFHEFDLDYTTHPISRTVVRPRLHPLIAELMHERA